MKQSLLFVIVLTLFASMLFAQQGELALHLFGSAGVPNGDFAKNIGDDTRITRISGFAIGERIGLAKTGPGAGFELIAPVWFRGLNWVFSSRIYVNGVNYETIQSAYRSAFVGDTVVVKSKNSIVEGVTLDFGRWINIPVMTGFRFDHHFTHKYTLYGIIQAGLNISKAPSYKATVTMTNPEGNRETITADNTKYSFARDFGYEVGVGFVLDQTYNIGFRYMSLSSPRYDGTKKLSEKVFPYIYSRENDIIGEERSISMFVVTLGIQLFR